MATYRVYKFRGHEYAFHIPIRYRPVSGVGDILSVAFLRFQLQGDLYLPEADWSEFHLYLVRALYSAISAHYPGSFLVPSSFNPDQLLVVGPSDFQERVAVTTFVEPTSGDTEVVYRRVRLRDRVLYFALSPSAEVDPGDADLGPLTRPAPRPLVAQDVAVRFRKPGDCECGGPASL